MFETLQVLEKNRNSLKDFEVCILANPESFREIHDGSAPIFQGLTSDIGAVLSTHFDISFNLSLVETSWDIHGQVDSSHKVGPYRTQGQVHIPDLWSSYYMTSKAKAPFLTFHLQDIFKNILGIKRIYAPTKKSSTIQTIAFGTTAAHLFSPEEQELLIQLINTQFPTLQLQDVSEIDHISDLSHVLYIGPSTLDAIKLCEGGAKGIFLTSHFQGFNLLPYQDGHLSVSTRGEKFKAQELFTLIHKQFHHEKLPALYPYSVYRVEGEHLFGPYLKNLNHADDNYPFYQSHVVLWNFILNLFDTNLEITQCSVAQVTLLKHHKQVLTKLIRLYDYAMSAIDSIHHEAKSAPTNVENILEHIKQLKEIDVISDHISQSHSFLRPVLDYYRLRRGQNQGETLLEQAQNSFLTYSEEHQALKALDELFSVTLRKNEVNI